MKGTIQRRLCVLLASAAAAWGVWKSVPGSALDRAAFETVAGGFVNGPLFVSGEGTHARPWEQRSFSVEAKPDKRQAPVIVSLGDDVQGIFQSSPPSPTDVAIIFKNFQRLGAKKAATAAVLAWETPDPVGLAALDLVLGRFDSLVMAAPLSRGPVSASMPQSFRQASLPLEAVTGDVGNLPMVNRVPLPGIILGGKNTMAGFTILESEAPTEAIPLLARWEDRVVLAFPLLTVLQRLDLPPEKLEIRLGQYLRIGPGGPLVPIDNFGALRLPDRKLAAYAEIPAEDLINGGDDLFPKQAPDPVVLRDDRGSAEPATRAFSRNLSMAIAALATEDGLTGTKAFPRLPAGWEHGLMGAMVVALTVCFAAGRFSRHVLAMVFTGLCFATQWIAFGLGSTWFPGIPLLAAVAAAYVVILVADLLGWARPAVRMTTVEAEGAGITVDGPVEDGPEVLAAPVSREVPIEQVAPESPPEVAAPVKKTAKATPAAPKKAPAKKTAPKKTAAKKAAPKKEVPKKTARKSPRGKKPPQEPSA